MDPMDPMNYDREFLTGTVGVLILSLLSEREMYGYEMLQEAERRSARAFQLKEGTLYPALHRLEVRGLLRSEWGTSENNRRAKYYRLSAAGRRELETEAAYWDRVAAAVTRVMQTA